MGSVRFSKVVEVAGKPDVHLLWMEASKDPVLQKAIKANRVVTLHQEIRGAKTDHGTVGYEKGDTAQILIFPKSVKAFAGKRIVGVKYDLLESKPIPKSQQAVRPKVPEKKKAPEKKKVAEEPMEEEPQKKAESVPKDKPEKKAEKKSEKRDTKVLPFPQPEAEEPEEDEEVVAIKAQVRKAMKALEDGKEVAAFNLLKRIVGE